MAVQRGGCALRPGTVAGERRQLQIEPRYSCKGVGTVTFRHNFDTVVPGGGVECDRPGSRRVGPSVHMEHVCEGSHMTRREGSLESRPPCFIGRGSGPKMEWGRM